MDSTPVSWHKVAKTGAIDGLIEVAHLIGHIPSIFYSDFGLIRWPLLISLILGGVCLRWAVAAATRYYQPGCVIGISTLALPSCAVSPARLRLVRVWFSPVTRVVSSGGFPIRRDYDIVWTTGTITC